jgi:hypothetical protein
MKPIYEKDKCIFNLKGTNELTGLWKPPVANVAVQKVDGKYTASDSSAKLTFTAKTPIIAETSKLFSISFWAQRTELNGSSWQQFGFWLNDITKMNFGFAGDKSIYIDDNGVGAGSSLDIGPDYLKDTSDAAYKKPIFYTICRDINRTYITVNGKLIPSGIINNLPSSSQTIDKIILFNADGGSITGWIDKVLIHRDVCLYKEDFTVDFTPADDYDEPSINTKKHYLKIY